MLIFKGEQSQERTKFGNMSFPFASNLPLSFASNVWLLSQHPDPRDKRIKQGEGKLAFGSLVLPSLPVKNRSQPGKG